MVDRAKQILRKIIYLENETSILDEIKATSLYFYWHSYDVGIIGGCKYETQPIRAGPWSLVSSSWGSPCGIKGKQKV